jgi:hypothetical protein
MPFLGMAFLFTDMVTTSLVSDVVDKNQKIIEYTDIRGVE